MFTAKTARLLEATRKTKREGPLHYDQGEGLDTARDWLRLHRASEQLEAELGELKERLLAAVRPWHEEQCVAGGFVACVLVPSAKGMIQVLLGNRFKKIPGERAGVLKKELGKDFDAAFEQVVSVKLRKSIAEDGSAADAAIRELARALGQDRFGELFETEVTLQPSEEFGRLLAMDSGLREGLGIEQIAQVSEKKESAKAAAKKAA